MSGIKAKLSALFKRDFTGTKPGIATSEFWIAGATSIIGVLTANGWIPTDVAARYQGDVHIFGYIAAAVASAGYALSRGITKQGGSSPADLLHALGALPEAGVAAAPAEAMINTLLAKLSAGVDSESAVAASTLNNLGASSQIKAGLDYLRAQLDGGLQDLHDHVDALEAKLEPKTGAADGPKHAAEPAVVVRHEPEPVEELAPPAGPGGFPDDVAVAPVPEEAPPAPPL